MTAQEAVNKIAERLLGKNWYSYYYNIEDINSEIVETICGRYRGKDEDPVTKWRRRHKRCCFCKHCRPIGIVPFTPRAFTCTAKGKDININTPRPFCGLFELRKEESND